MFLQRLPLVGGADFAVTFVTFVTLLAILPALPEKIIFPTWKIQSI